MMTEQDSETNQLLQKMMEQISQLQAQVTALQQKPPEPMETLAEEKPSTSCRLVKVSDATKAFLETAFSGTMDNDDRTARIKRIVVPDCDQIRCPKLDGVLKATLPTDAIKVDSYLSQLQQFWLDAVSPLAAILESAEAGELSPEKAVSSVQVALCLMGNVHQHMTQEATIEAESLPNLSSWLKTEKTFNPQHLCCLARNSLSWPMPLWINRKP